MEFLTIKEFLCQELLLPPKGKIISEIFNSDGVENIKVEIKNRVFRPKYKQHVLLAAASSEELEKAYIECLKSFCLALQNNIERSSNNSNKALVRFKHFSNGKAVKVSHFQQRLIYSMEYDVIIKR